MTFLGIIAFNKPGDKHSTPSIVSKGKARIQVFFIFSLETITFAKTGHI
jgi:hypothetical protein